MGQRGRRRGWVVVQGSERVDKRGTVRMTLPPSSGCGAHEARRQRDDIGLLALGLEVGLALGVRAGRGRGGAQTQAYTPERRHCGES